MGEPASTKRSRQATGAVVELSLERFDRLVRVLERMVTVEERKLAARGSAERRALKQAGPTTDEAIEAVRKRLSKIRGKRE